MRQTKINQPFFSENLKSKKYRHLFNNVGNNCRQQVRIILGGCWTSTSRNSVHKQNQ